MGYGKGTAMKLHHTLAIGALLCAVVTAALAQQSINSSQMATSLANVSGNNRLAMTGAQMRQAVLDYIRDNPGALPPRPMSFPQLEGLTQFVVEVDFDFGSAVIRPSSYRTVGAIADALHHPLHHLAHVERAVSDRDLEERVSDRLLLDLGDFQAPIFCAGGVVADEAEGQMMPEVRRRARASF